MFLANADGIKAAVMVHGSMDVVRVEQVCGIFSGVLSVSPIHFIGNGDNVSKDNCGLYDTVAVRGINV